jgi:uncharacterized protein (DUF427 family)
MSGYPSAIAAVDHIEPVPRRIRAMFGGRVVVDSREVKYLWEFPPYPQYYVPLADVADGVLVDTGEVEETSRGKARVHTAGKGQARVYDDGVAAGLVRFDWDAMDSWYEEEEEVFVHPRNPYSRCDAVRSSRHVKVERDGKVLAESSSTVIVFETGLPPRYYFPRLAVNFEHLTPSETRTACPYKGRTTGYWSVGKHPDLAWCYDFPTGALLPIAGLVAFLDERVDVTIDGERQARPKTHF